MRLFYGYFKTLWRMPKAIFTFPRKTYSSTQFVFAIHLQIQYQWNFIQFGFFSRFLYCYCHLFFPSFPPKGFFLDLLPILIEAAIKSQGFLFLYLSCILAYKYVGRGGENKALISFQPSTPLLTLWLSLFCFSFFRIYEESVRKYLAKKTS